MTYDLEKIEEVCSKATPGPWEVVKMTSKKARSANARNHTEYYRITVNGNNMVCYLTKEDAQFINIARTALPELCARVRELEAEILDPVELAKIAMMQIKFKELEAENAALRADNAGLVKWFKAIKLACNTNYDPNKIISALADVIDRHILHTPHPGDSLLKELEGLRKVAEAAKKVVKDPDGNYWDDYRVDADYFWQLDKALTAAQRPTDCGPGEGKEG